MQTLEIVLLMSGAVIVSSIIGKLIPKVSAPIIQIFLGAILSITVTHYNVPQIDPEMFLLLFISPLLYFEAREANIIALWKNRRRILSLAIGLVIVLMLAVGCATYLLVPATSLAAACAMGAALGPTDAVAVTSLKSSAKLGEKEDAILQGEALLNDASGIVAFQFAVTAAVAGEFSLADASISFLMEFFGGIAFGIILAMIIHRLQMLFHERGIDTLAFNVTLEILNPFIIFLLSDVTHVSGILAVVSAGLLLSTYTKKVMGPNSAKFGIASTTVSSTIKYILEGIVFVLLGMQLPQIVYRQWTDAAITNETLIALVLILTAVVVGVRFLWVFVGERLNERKKKQLRREKRRAALNSTIYDPLLIKEMSDELDEKDSDLPVSRFPNLRHALITTLGGAKGAVTLSIVMSIPYLVSTGEAFPHRELLIFLASGVIFCTLLLANFFLPILAPAPDKSVTSGLPETDEELAEIKIGILNRVIKHLLDESDNYNAAALRSVVLAYNDRINRIRTEWDLDSDETVKLRLKVLDVQYSELKKIEASKQAPEMEITRNMLRIAKARRLLTHKNSYGQVIAAVLLHIPSAIKLVASYSANVAKRFLGYPVRRPRVNVRLMLEQKAVDYLESLLGDGDPTGDPSIPDNVIKERLMAHQSSVEGVSVSPFNVAAFARKSPELMELERDAYNLELEEVTTLLEDGHISRGAAKLLRDNIYLMMVDLDPEL